MFVAIPLDSKPTWRSPPWMTVLLIALQCFIYWGWQVGEEKAVERAGARYAATPLPRLELPPFIDHLRAAVPARGGERERALATAAQRFYQKGAHAALYQLMWQEGAFRKRLLAGEVIRPGMPGYGQWKAARDAFAPQEPRPFTRRWAMSYESGAGLQPVQALTSTFLHGSTGHLVGNMVFLFLFGFTLEVALGSFAYLAFYLLGGLGASYCALAFYAGTGSFGLGASGAVSALMGMYAVLYRMRRIRFFYIFLFYFNYARWPALVMLPVWMAFELAQHFLGGRGVAYMAHFGGLLTGAACMWLYMRLRPVQAPPDAAGSRAEEDRPLREAVARARRYGDALDFERATPAWRAAARLAPGDAQVLGAWFHSARHDPAGEDFHAAARLIFKLPARADGERRLQHASYLAYRDRARPAARISPDTMHALVRSFVRLGELAEAEQLCRALERHAEHPQWPQTLALVANGMAQAGRMEAARAWLPALRRAAPQEPVTRWLEGRA